MKKAMFRSNNVVYSYEYDEKENSKLDRVKEITINGIKFTRENQAKKGWTWKTTARGIIIYFADETGLSLGKPKTWLEKNAGRIDKEVTSVHPINQ